MRIKNITDCVLLSIVWNSFSNAFLTSYPLPPSAVLKAGGTAVALHVFYLIACLKLLLPFNSPATAVAAAISTSHKTLAFGMPLIKTAFANDPDLAAYLVPLMVVHPAQLFVGGALRGWLCKKALDERSE